MPVSWLVAWLRRSLHCRFVLGDLALCLVSGQVDILDRIIVGTRVQIQAQRIILFTPVVEQT
ncbi:hypothetical protein [Paenibacillus sonchi]|uniref:hypothetical protein n=1 Tax=Paenibacillus sonchi TaxID=373687 RepID=UPI001E4B9444|nr:hypothetical protein [Paenibacillus sonchi]